MEIRRSRFTKAPPNAWALSLSRIILTLLILFIPTACTVLETKIEEVSALQDDLKRLPEAAKGTGDFLGALLRGDSKRLTLSSKGLNSDGANRSEPAENNKPTPLTPEQVAERKRVLTELRDWRSHLEVGDHFKHYQWGIPVTDEVIAITGQMVHYRWKNFMGVSKQSVHMSYVFPPKWGLVGKIRTACNGFNLNHTAIGTTYSVQVDTNNPDLFTSLDRLEKVNREVSEQEPSEMRDAAQFCASYRHALERANDRLKKRNKE